MNRAEFFAQVKRDLFQTVKEIVYPLIDDDIKKLESFTKDLNDNNWFLLGEGDFESILDVEDRYINNRSITIFRSNDKLMAIDKVCSHCNSIISWVSYEKKFICFNCDRGFSIINEEGELKPTFYNLEKQKNRWYISIKN